MGSSVASALRRASVACGFGPPDRRAPTRRGELTSLDALGIVSLDVHAQPLDATTPQGAWLTAYGDVTFTGGTVRRMVAAVIDNRISDRKVA